MNWTWFGILLSLTMGVHIIYGINMVRWRNSPDFGWRTMYTSGPNVVAQVLEIGEAAGLRVGDKILAINRRTYNSFEELYFRVRHDVPGSVNTYTVIRDGRALEISITTDRLGLRRVLWRSAGPFLMGLIYVLIGVLVFLMKPRAAESWLFFVMTCVIGMEITFSAPSDLMRPLWLFDVRQLVDVVIPAPAIHLALRFPRTRTFLRKRPWLWIVPYLISMILFILYEVTSPYYWESPVVLDNINDSYLMLAALVLLVSMIWNFLMDTSVMVRLQSKTIFIGILLAFLIPTIDLLLRAFLDTYLFPNRTLGAVVCLTFFPLSIGYTIVKHDLFAIDALIKRTYGYLLTTGAIAGTYALFVLVSNLAFGRLS